MVMVPRSLAGMPAGAEVEPTIHLAPKTSKSLRRRWYYALVKLVRSVVLLQDTPYRISMGAAVGTFCAVLPIVGQIVVGAFLARMLRANVVVCLAWAWISNPLTVAPILYADYRIGAVLLGLDPVSWNDLTSDLTGSVVRLFKPLAVGSLLLGLVLGALAFVIMHPVVLAQQRRRAARIRAWAGR